MSKKFLIPAIIFLLVSVAGCSSTTSIPQDRKYLVAVMAFENSTGDAEQDVYLSQLQEKMIDGLLASGRVRLIERNRISEVLKEKELQQSGVLSTSDAMKIGQLLGAEAVCTGSLNRLSSDFDVNQAMMARNEKLTVTVELTSRIIHAGTGEILSSATVTEKSSDSADSIGKKISSGSINEEETLLQALDKAARGASEKLGESMPLKSK